MTVVMKAMATENNSCEVVTGNICIVIYDRRRQVKAGTLIINYRAERIFTLDRATI